MSELRRESGGGVTLFGCTVLHAFSHAYASMLVPLYLLMVRDLHLPGVRAASLVVGLYGMVYCSFSYFAGVLADRANRRNLLAVGLAVNALAIIGIGLTRRYEMVLVCAVVAGLAGTLFHPAAGTLVPAHFPKSPGMAVGLLGIGAGVGFFAGPQIAGWRSQAAHWHLGSVAAWQKPCVELGIAGLVAAGLFWWFAREAVDEDFVGKTVRRRPALGSVLSRRVIAVAAVLGLRDFAGVGLLSLGSVYLQKALRQSPEQTGFVLGAMTAMSAVTNPLVVWFSGGPRRLPAMTIALLACAAAMAIVPMWSASHVLGIFCAAQTLQLATYAISDAAILERVPAAQRGRVYGLFLTIAGTFANTAPWVMGYWTDHFGAAGNERSTYWPAFLTLAAFAGLASLSVPIIGRLGKASVEGIDPLMEIAPGTMEPAL